MVVLYGWEGNRRSGVALATQQSVVCTSTDSIVHDGEMSTSPMLLYTASFTFMYTSHALNRTRWINNHVLRNMFVKSVTFIASSIVYRRIQADMHFARTHTIPSIQNSLILRTLNVSVCQTRVYVLRTSLGPDRTLCSRKTERPSASDLEISRRIKAKFNYASWFEDGRRQI